MADAPEKAPRIDPAIDATGQSHDAENKDKPRDSKGWDGKLRVEKNVLVNGRDQDADSDAEDVSEDEGPPPEQLPADEDLLEDYPEDEEDIELVHLRISDMAALRLDRFKKLKVCGMRSGLGLGMSCGGWAAGTLYGTTADRAHVAPRFSPEPDYQRRATRRHRPTAPGPRFLR